MPWLFVPQERIVFASVRGKNEHAVDSFWRKTKVCSEVQRVLFRNAESHDRRTRLASLASESWTLADAFRNGKLDGFNLAEQLGATFSCSQIMWFKIDR